MNESADVRPAGEVLGQLLELHYKFIIRAYELLRSVQRLIPGEELAAVWPSPIRNGGESKFTGQDRVQSYMGTAFVSRDLRKGKIEIPADGLPLLVFQLRWLERSPEEPVIWAVKALAKATAHPSYGEHYYSELFRQLARPSGLDRSGPFELPEWEAKSTAKEAPNRKILLSGLAIEVPFADLKTEADVAEKLFGPAMKLWRSGD